MANTLSAIVPKIIARGLKVLRQNAVMPQKVNRDYDITPQNPGSTVSVSVPVAQTAAAITPANTPPSNTDVTPTVVEVAVDQFYGTSFHLNDKDATQIDAQAGFLPGQVGESFKAIANNVNEALLSLYTDIYSAAGTAGTTPFATTTAAWTTEAGARTLLNKTLAPLEDRSVMLDADAEGNAINLEGFQNAAWTGDPSASLSGEIGHRLGASWYLNQGVQSHTKGTLTAGTALQSNATHAIGVTTMVFKDSGGSLSGTVVKGDIFTVAGDTQQYVCTELATAASNLVSVNFLPALKVANSAGDVVTMVASHVANLAFQRDAFALASAPLMDSTFGMGNIIPIVDPVSGLVLRLEIRRDYKQTTWDIDILYGCKTVSAERACRILG